MPKGDHLKKDICPGTSKPGKNPGVPKIQFNLLDKKIFIHFVTFSSVLRLTIK